MFDFDDSNLEIKFWREEFINYIIENKAFNEKEIEILKELQLAENAKIQVNFKKEINIYCYTSNLHEYSKLNAYGVIEEQLENNVDVKIYNRNYILNNLNIKHEIIEEQNLYPELDVKHLGKKIENEKVGDPSLIITKPQEAKNESPKKPIISPNLELNKTDYLKNTNQYPEIVAFKDIDLNRESVSENLEEVISGYARKLIRGFAAHNIPIDIKENIIGSSVIRIYIELPKSISQNKITPHLKDIIIWLGLKTEPHLSIDENGLYLDILRESPSIIYYDYFMGKVREKFNQEELKIQKLNDQEIEDDQSYNLHWSSLKNNKNDLTVHYAGKKIHSQNF